MSAGNDFEKRTYNYLRLAMIAVLILLAVAILRERAKVTGCWQGSISAYYYTPVHAVFIGALVTVGACMIVLKGATTLKDVLLNLGGLLAPVVAFVPTPNAGSCSSAEIVSRRAAVDIANNMFAYFVVGAVALLVALILGLTAKGEAKWGRTEVVGFVASVVLWLAGIIWLKADPDSFNGNAHYTAAALLFAVIIGIVFMSARGQRHQPVAGVRERKVFARAYGVIAAAMAVCLVIGLIARSSGILWIETALLGLFLLYWVLRTAEQWRADTEITAPEGQVEESKAE